jgi:ferredoxin, 2Fe-2S
MASRDKIKRLLKRSRSLARQLRNTTNEKVPEAPVTVEFGNQKIQVPAHTTLLEAAIQLELDLDHFCGGNCSCGSCRIQVLQGSENLSSPRPNEQMVLGPDAQHKGDRLACQARAMGPVSIGIPDFFMV